MSKHPVCPTCHVVLNAFSDLDLQNPVIPIEGDYSVCSNCMGLTIFDEDLTLQIMSDQDVIALSDENLVELLHTRNALRKYAEVEQHTMVIH